MRAVRVALLPAAAAAAAAAGDISSVVSALGASYEWPEAFAALKERLRPEKERLAEAWRRLEAALEGELRELEERQEKAVPVLDFAEIREGRLPPAVEKEVRKRGVVVVRNVVDKDVARGWKAEVERYARENPEHVGFPKEKPQVLELYWSRAQVEARQHENMHATMVALNGLWKDAGGHVSFDEVLTYGERLRIRQPGEGFSLHPHTDGGSIERFEDEHYQNVYKNVWQGEWERYDPWGNAGERALANVSMYTSEVANGYCTVFRAFQGWVAVSSIAKGPDAGTLRVLPLLREATAYILMRPFLEDVPAADFCGAVPGMSHDVTPKWHGRLHRGMVPLPRMEPGDTVWWHADLVHAVEAKHAGEEDSAVFYVPSLPATVKNAEYVKLQKELFRAGRTPPDFPPNDSEMGFAGRAGEAALTELGRRMMGLAPLSRGCGDEACASGQGLLAEVDRILGF